MLPLIAKPFLRNQNSPGSYAIFNDPISHLHFYATFSLPLIFIYLTVRYFIVSWKSKQTNIAGSGACCFGLSQTGTPANLSRVRLPDHPIRIRKFNIHGVFWWIIAPVTRLDLLRGIPRNPKTTWYGTAINCARPRVASQTNSSAETVNVCYLLVIDFWHITQYYRRFSTSNKSEWHKRTT